MPKLTDLKALDHYRLWMRYDDGVEGVVDLSEFAGKGVFVGWNDYREFEKASIGAGGEITWGDDIDMCSDAMYLRITGKKPEELFPALNQVFQNA